MRKEKKATKNWNQETYTWPQFCHSLAMRFWTYLSVNSLRLHGEGMESLILSTWKLIEALRIINWIINYKYGWCSWEKSSLLCGTSINKNKVPSTSCITILHDAAAFWRVIQLFYILPFSEQRGRVYQPLLHSAIWNNIIWCHLHDKPQTEFRCWTGWLYVQSGKCINSLFRTSSYNIVCYHLFISVKHS